MHFLHIVMLVQDFHQLEHLLCGFLFQLYRILRYRGDFCKCGIDFRIGKRLLHRFKVVRIRDDLKAFLAHLHILCSCIERKAVTVGQCTAAFLPTNTGAPVDESADSRSVGGSGAVPLAKAKAALDNLLGPVDGS